MKKHLVFCLYNFIIIIILGLIGELTTRYFFPQIQLQGTTKNLFVDNAYFCSSGLTPGSCGFSNGVSVKISPFGFRECSTKIDTSQISWLILGDSVTFGIGVEADSTVAGRLQSSLRSLNILNPATLGYAIQDYENLVNHFIFKQNNKFRIAKILLFWCLNDIYLVVPDWETPGGSWRYLLGDVLKFIRCHSRFYMLCKTTFFDRPKSYYLFDEKFYETNRPEFRNAIQKINTISEICHSQKIDFAVVLLPYEFQFRKIGSIRDQPQMVMKRELSKLGIKCLDPLHYLCAQGIASKKMYLFGDGIHLSKAGHKAIAEFLNKSFP